MNSIFFRNEDEINALSFIRESNRIEGINRRPIEKELIEYYRFMELPLITIADLVQFVKVYQPDALLRDHSKVSNVRIGNDIAPYSGVSIRIELDNIIHKANKRYKKDAFDIHSQYETLHPFTDGNGRSGRMLWLWTMRRAPLGFLHHWYYQSLENSRK